MRVQSIEGSNFSAGSSKLLGTSFDTEPENFRVTRFSAEPWNLQETTVTEVPEPEILLLYGIGLLGIGLRGRSHPVYKTFN